MILHGAYPRPHSLPLQIRLGVTADDQKTLHLAELRHIAAGSDLRVGRITVPFAAAFYPVPPPDPAAAAKPGPGGRVPASSSSYRRITPVLRGRVHVLHGTNRSHCRLFNGGRGARQLVQWRVGVQTQHEVVRTAKDAAGGDATGASAGAATNASQGVRREGRRWEVSIMAYEDVRTAAQCEALLGAEKRYCLLSANGSADDGAAGGGECTPPAVYDGYPYVVPARMETLAGYMKSTRWMRGGGCVDCSRASSQDTRLLLWPGTRRSRSPCSARARGRGRTLALHSFGGLRGPFFF